jgi:hypothetical protein
MKRAIATIALLLLAAAPAAAGPLTTLQNLLIAPDAGYTTNGLALGATIFSGIITTSIIVRLCRLAWVNHGDFGGWHTELGDLIWSVMVPGYATLIGARLILPEIQPLVGAISGAITGRPGIANPDAIFTLGITTAAELFVGAIHPITGAAAIFGIPLVGVDALWMTGINLAVALVAGVIVVLSLTRVAFEMVAAVAGGLFSVAIGAVSVAFAGSSATREISMRYGNAVWVTIMRIVCIVAYAALVADVFAAVPFAAGLMEAGTFLQTAFALMAASYAVGAGASRVAGLADAMFAGGVFLTAGHVGAEATAAPRAAVGLAVTAGKAFLRRA